MRAALTQIVASHSNSLRVFIALILKSGTLDQTALDNIIVFDTYQTYVITSKDDDELTVLDVDYRTLAAECITDTRRDLDAWAAFLYQDADPEILQKRKYDMLWLCDTMEDQYVRRN